MPIYASKPSIVPSWATDPTADKVVPPAGKKSRGWIAGERPPAGFMNWLQALGDSWHQYLNDFENNAHDWSVAFQTFGAALIANNAPKAMLRAHQTSGTITKDKATNIGVVQRINTGQVEINFSTAFADANYIVALTASTASASIVYIHRSSLSAAGKVIVDMRDKDGSFVDITSVNWDLDLVVFHY